MIQFMQHILKGAVDDIIGLLSYIEAIQYQFIKASLKIASQQDIVSNRMISYI